MGWYVKCQTCGAERMDIHPDCGCLQKRRLSVLQKITGATVLMTLVKDEECAYQFLYTKYQKENLVFWVRIVLVNGHDSYAIHDTIAEVLENDVYGKFSAYGPPSVDMGKTHVGVGWNHDDDLCYDPSEEP